ncbi:MAG: 1-acyl-sn-glycerol-3-phosphate acyltransferase [Oscillochloridaceae bacterium]|nr:1-acyl-sn-glycerol-3-phosphate acyltransferase [Chloroflexaceae bacterium]MDW8390495.1 1-acyl-sn-glycerol-3-phosphate acyltransferase [Oscillochloridaceae bacterium]
MSDDTSPNGRPTEAPPGDATEGLPEAVASPVDQIAAQDAVPSPDEPAPEPAQDAVTDGAPAPEAAQEAVPGPDEPVPAPLEAAAPKQSPRRAASSAATSGKSSRKNAAAQAAGAAKSSRAKRGGQAQQAPAAAMEAAPGEEGAIPAVKGADAPEEPARSASAPSWFDVPITEASPSPGAAPTAAPSTSFWSERPVEVSPPPSAGSLYEASNAERAAGSANTLFEFEVEVRNNVPESPASEGNEIQNMANDLLRLISENLRRMTDQQVERVNEILRNIDLKDYLDPDFWKGIGMVLRYQIDEQVAFIKRRLNGEYSTDPFGMDPEVIAVVRPFVRFMYRTWWRVKAEGLEHVPATGRALLVANHSGVLPWDGAMIAAAVAEDHPAQNDRIVRSLHLHWFTTLPFVAPTLAAMGQVPGLPENAIRLLQNDELVCVFPEGLKGVGKLYKDRYKLARFGRGGFVQAALRAQAPIVPVAVVGAEEIYPMLANAQPIAKLLGMPYFPITPFFPWLGVFGAIPLPTRWSITFCEPLPTDTYDPSEADDPLTVLGLTELVRERIQATIDAKLAERKTIF